MANEIKGVNLSDLMNEVEDELLTGKKAEVRKVMLGIYGDLARWEREIATKEKEILGLKDKRIGAMNKITKLRQGDWSALPSAQQKQEGQSNDDKQA